MLKRKVYSRLLEWKDTPGHRPLIVYGCRQCGKTYSVVDFAQRNYGQVVYLNFFEHPEYNSIFAGSLSASTVLLNISALLQIEKEFIVGDTCFIFDEIQECPEARTALKFLSIDGRYDYICTGSWLGMSGYRVSPASIPVGYEEHLIMYPLDFEEFLWACGQTDAVIDYLKECLSNLQPVSEAIHNKMRELMQQYIIVGGMPDVVNSFIEKKHLGIVRQKQHDILTSYRNDMIKYATREMKAYIVDCFDSIPRQLSRENKKFQYATIKKGARAERYDGSLRWIEDAGIIKRCYNLEITQLPYKGNYLPDMFKVYMMDTGLLVAMLDDSTQYDILQGNIHIYKGAIFENLIAGIFAKMGRELYYYHKDGGIELDFLIRYKGESTPIEVKAVNGNAKSLKTVMAHPEKYDIHQAIKLIDGNVGGDNRVITLPHYMAFLLNEK